MGNEITAQRLGLRRSFLFALTASLAANAFLAAALLMKPSPMLTIVIPPEGSEETAWRFTEKGVDARYFERWALSAVSLAATLSPSTIESSITRLLKLAAPEAHTALEKKLLTEAEGLKADRASVTFFPSRTRTDAGKLIAHIQGVKKILIGSVVASSATTVFRVSARYDAGRLFLVSLTELSQEEARKLFD